MKYKVLGISLCIVLLVVCSMNLPLLFAKDTGRYHQHQEAQEKKPCSHDKDTFCTHLPLMSIDTGGASIPGKPVMENHTRVGYTTAEDGSDRIQAQMAVFDDEEKNNHLTDTPTVTNNCSKVIHKDKPPKMDGFYYSPNVVGSFGKRKSSKLSNGPFLPERWSFVYSAFSSTSLSISFFA